MTQKTFDLDQAIDVIAKRLTQVDDDPVLASKIIASLPERTTWFGWWMPRLAGLAALFVVAASSLLLFNRQPAPVMPAPLPAAVGAMVVALPAALEPVELQLGTKPLERLEPLEPLELQAVDHEFSLPSLDVETLIEPAPLAIGDLPLSGEFPERY